MVHQLLFVCLIVSSACGSFETVSREAPTTPRMEPPPAGAYGTLSRNREDGTLMRDPVRDELREILIPCQRRLDRMRDERVDERRRERILSVIAMMLQTVYLSAFDGAQNNPAGARCTGGTLDQNCAMAQERQFGFRFGGSNEDVIGPQVLPERAIDGALEAVDSVLWTAPDSNDWDEEERERYEARRNDLSRLCEQLRRAESES